MSFTRSGLVTRIAQQLHGSQRAVGTSGVRPVPRRLGAFQWHTNCVVNDACQPNAMRVRSKPGRWQAFSNRRVQVGSVIQFDRLEATGASAGNSPPR
eukprot:13591067-Heterocapsa_arctica.AAC.1